MLELSVIDLFNLGSSFHNVVEFYWPHCRACQSFAPVYEELAKDNPDMNFYKMNVKASNENGEDLGRKWGVTAVPTVRVFGREITPGKGLLEILGSKSKETIQALLDQHKGTSTE
ncbi:thioredoxin family protein [Neorickettsia helminthoeca]|nr:thioredoxin family protein [Neorickettsia helminthoeca]